MLALSGASPLNERSSEIDDALRQYYPGYFSTSNLASKEDLGSEDGDGEKLLNEAIMSSFLEGDENGEQSLMAAMMEGNEEQAVAQFRFFRNILGRLETSRLGRFIIPRIKQRYCNTRGK